MSAGAESAAEMYGLLLRLARAGEPFAVATVLSVDGSTPRSVGAKMVITPDGALRGTVGGGAVEAEAIRRGVAVCVSEQVLCFDVSLDGASVGDAPPLCGGTVRVLVDGAARRHAQVYAEVVAALEARCHGEVVTVVEHGESTSAEVRWSSEGPHRGHRPEAGGTLSGPHSTHPPGGTGVPACAGVGSPLPSPPAPLPRERGARAERGRGEGGPTSLEGEPAREVLVEPVAPDPSLLVIGGGHIGQALAVQGRLLGFAVTVIDDRPEFTDPSLFPPDVHTRTGDPARELHACPMDDDTYIVIVTRGHQHDAAALRACLGARAAYIGVIGSRRKAALVRADLLASGARAEHVARVHCPVGLDIGAETVAEIAVSIAAQLVAVRRRKDSLAGSWGPPA